MDRFVRSELSKGDDKKGLYPESLFKVTLTDTEIVNEKPDGSVERVPLAELKEFYIVTNTSGPWGGDLWWLFVGSKEGSGCAFPGGATGEQQMVSFVEQLPGFDADKFIAAMGSTSNARFLCWQART